jgi:hypothetical protein
VYIVVSLALQRMARLTVEMGWLQGEHPHVKKPMEQSHKMMELASLL